MHYINRWLAARRPGGWRGTGHWDEKSVNFVGALATVLVLYASVNFNYAFVLYIIRAYYW